MKVLTFAAQKGGTGKSTLAVMCAMAAQEAGHKVALFDLDKQGTISQWYEEREQDEPSVYAISADEVPTALEALRKQGIEFVFIDTAGVDSPEALAAIRASDMCLIPTRPAPQDLKALRPTYRAVVRLEKQFAFILNQVGPRLYKRYQSAVEGLDSIAQVAEPLIVQRNDFQDAFGLGLSVKEFNASGKAAEEIASLWVWISEKIEGKANGKKAA